MHLDQNEKLVHFGVTHVAALDGYGGKLLDIVTMPIKNNLLIIIWYIIQVIIWYCVCILCDFYDLNYIRPIVLEHGL